MDIMIRNIPEEYIKILDKIAVEEGLSRNALILKILDNYTACRDKFIINSLPLIVRSLVTDELERMTLSAKSVENNVYISSLRLLEIAEKIENLLLPQLEKSDKKPDENALETSEILRILKMSETLGS